MLKEKEHYHFLIKEVRGNYSIIENEHGTFSYPKPLSVNGYGVTLSVDYIRDGIVFFEANFIKGNKVFLQ